MNWPRLEPGNGRPRIRLSGRSAQDASTSASKTKGVSTRRDLRRHRCLMGFARGAVPQSQWPLSGGGQLHVEGVFSTNDLQLLCALCVRGFGIALLPLLIAHPFLQSGALVPVLEGVIVAEARVAIVYVEREFVPPQVRAFVDAVVAWAPTAIGQRVPP